MEPYWIRSYCADCEVLFRTPPGEDAICWGCGAKVVKGSVPPLVGITLRI